MQRFARAGIAAGVGVMAVLVAGTARPVAAADEKAPDWSGFATVTSAVGEVVKADDNGLTLKVTWYVPQGGTGNRRPSLRGGRGYSMRRPGGSGGVKLKEMHHEYALEYVPQTLVRYKTIPPKLDEKGKKVPHTDKERRELQQPLGVPGYAADKSQVASGMHVEVLLIRDRTIPLAKLTEDDLRVKYVFILPREAAPPSQLDSKTDSKKN